MKNTILILTLFVFGQAHADLVEPKILRGKSVQLKLGPDVEKALKSFDADFRVHSEKDYIPSAVDLFRDLPNELPMAVIGDFNGDKIKDVILMGQNSQQERVVAALSEKNSFKIVSINTSEALDPSSSEMQMDETRTEKGLFVYLGLVPKGSLKADEKSAPVVKYDAFQLEQFQGPTFAYFFKDGGFKLFAPALGEGEKVSK